LEVLGALHISLEMYLIQFKDICKRIGRLKPIGCGRIFFDVAMKTRRVVIKKHFGSLKNQWINLNDFNSRIDIIVPISVACCVIHNYYEKWNCFE
jgi:hypothetical protein